MDTDQSHTRVVYLLVVNLTPDIVIFKKFKISVTFFFGFGTFLYRSGLYYVRMGVRHRNNVFVRQKLQFTVLGGAN